MTYISISLAKIIPDDRFSHSWHRCIVGTYIYIGLNIGRDVNKGRHPTSNLEGDRSPLSP